MNRRIGFLTAVLAVAGILTVRGAFSQPTPQATRKVIKLAGGLDIVECYGDFVQGLKMDNSPASRRMIFVR